MRMILFLLMLVSLHWLDLKIIQSRLPLKTDKSALKKPLHSLKLKNMTRGNLDFWIPPTKRVINRRELSNWNNIEVISPLTQ